MSEKKYELFDAFARIENLLRAYNLRNWRTRGPIADPYRGQGRVLALLALQETISQSDLAFLLGMRSQSLGELLVKLEKNGFITRSTSDADKRVTLITLTEEGKNAAAEVTRDLDKYALFDFLSPEEQETLYGLLERVAEAIEAELGDSGYGRQADKDEAAGEYYKNRIKQRQELLGKMRTQHGEYFKKIAESEPVAGAMDFVRDIRRDFNRELAKGKRYWAEVRFGNKSLCEDCEEKDCEDCEAVPEKEHREGHHHHNHEHGKDEKKDECCADEKTAAPPEPAAAEPAAPAEAMEPTPPAAPPIEPPPEIE